MKIIKSIIETPIGNLEIHSNSIGVYEVLFTDKPKFIQDKITSIHADAIEQIENYFLGKLKIFNITLNLIGTEFQKRVWKELQKIPYGETISYLELAIRLGDSKSIRAVANANAHNPVSIVVPCHRVIGSDGTLVGYAGGLERKKWLLLNEAKHSNKEIQLDFF